MHRVREIITCTTTSTTGSCGGEEATKLMIDQKRNEWREARKTHESLLAGGEYLIHGHGPIEDFHRGLSSILGPPKKLLYEAMEKEFCDSADSDVEYHAENYGIKTTPRIEWNFVIDPSEKNIKKLGLERWPTETNLKEENRRKPKSIDDFDDELERINSSLQRLGLPRVTFTEIIALRLYTGPMGVKLNKMIRAHAAGHREGQEWRIDEVRKACLGNKYSTTVHVIQSTISKLGKINPNNKAYTGLDNLLLNESFWKINPELNTRGGVEGGFMSLSMDREVAKHYATLKDGKLGIMFEVEMGTMDRGAELGWLSQYPHEVEIILPPLSYIHVEHIRLERTNDTLLMIVEVRVRISQSIKVKKPLLTDAENLLIRQVVKEDRLTDFITNSKLLSRFSDEENFLVTGNPMESVIGLSHLLGVDDFKIQKARVKGIEALKREILQSEESEVIKNMNYVLYEAASECQFSNGIRDMGNTGKNLVDFVNHPIAKKYQLREEHVAALRIYTTSAFRFINGPLRKKLGNKEAHPFPITVTLIDDAIKKLRASTAEKFENRSSSTCNEEKENIYLWRGIKNTKITEDFIKGRRGGTEFGLMSTTKDLKIAVEYSKSLEGNALLFKYKIDNVKKFGADVSWLSAFPSEEEILYPPLTYLQPTGKVEMTTINRMIFTTVEIEPHL